MIGPDQPLPVSIRRDPAAVAQYQTLWNVLLRDEAIRALRPLTVRNFLGFVRRVAGPNVDPMEVRLYWSVPQILTHYHRAQKWRCSVPVVRSHARWMTTWLGRTIAPHALSTAADSSLMVMATPPLHTGERKHYFDVDEVHRLHASARLDPSGLDAVLLTILFTTGLTSAMRFCGNPLLGLSRWVVPHPVDFCFVVPFIQSYPVCDRRKGGSDACGAARTLCAAGTGVVVEVSRVPRSP
jgi:hypothetical protein